MKDYIDYSDKEAKNLFEIKKNEVKIGDYADIDGNSGMCYGGYEIITDITTRYDEETGKAYKVICCGKCLYRLKDGSCIKGASAYEVYGYYRHIDSNNK